MAAMDRAYGSISSGRTAPVTVRADDVALGYLGKDRLPASVGERLTDLERLVALVVEIQHDRV